MGRKSKAPKAPKTLWDKVNEFDPNFAAEVQTMSDDALRTKLVALSNDDEKIETAKENDPDLISLSNSLKTARETYTIPLKENRKRKKLLIEYLRSRGQLAAE